MNIINIENQLKELSYSDKSKLFTRTFGFGTIESIKLNDKLILISLIAFAHSKLKVNNPDLTILDLLLQITKVDKDKNKHFYDALENLAIYIEDLTYGSKEFDSCGLDNSKDIINKIREYLLSWLPF